MFWQRKNEDGDGDPRNFRGNFKTVMEWVQKKTFIILKVMFFFFE